MAKSSEALAPQQETVRSSSRGLLQKLALILPLALLLVYFVNGAREVEATRGIEGSVRRADFVSTLTGATIIHDGNGAHLYDLSIQRATQNRVLAPYFALDENSILPYNHLPFEALFVSLFIGLPYVAIFGVWTLLMGLALALSLWLMYRTLPLRREVLPIMLLALISYQPLFRSFMLGQNSPLVLLGLCGTYAALKHGRQDLAGIALLLVALKPQILPVVVLAVLLQRHWRTLLVFGGSLVALCLAAMLVLGAGWPMDYAQLLLGVANWRDTGAIDPAIMHNWRGFATDLFGSWAPGLVTPIFVLLMLASILYFGFWILDFGFRRDRNNPKSKIQNPKSEDLIWALTGILAVLTSLHLNPHDLTLLIFPAWIMGAYATSGMMDLRQSRLLLILLWTGYALIPLTLYTGLSAEYPGLAVVPNVLLMASAALLLTQRQLHVTPVDQSLIPTTSANKSS